MPENQIRLSQLIGYYGPGAMLDLPDRSVLVLGLDHWDQRRDAFRLIEEPRLSRLLRLRLEGDNRLATSGDPQLRTPPLDLRDPRRPSPKIRATIFPQWFACDAVPGDPPDRRRLVRFQQLEPPRRLEHRGDDGKRRHVSPTGEKTLPALDAAHIRPFAEGGAHETLNGLLLRRDIHSLFDAGYVTVTPALRFEVSGRIREEFENGRHYYALHGQPVAAPDAPDRRPAPAALA